MVRLAGPTSSRRCAPIYWNLPTDWAAMTMRIACAAKKEDKKLTIAFEASEVMCLAELLKQKQNLRSISVYGETNLCLIPPGRGSPGLVHNRSLGLYLHAVDFALWKTRKE